MGSTRHGPELGRAIDLALCAPHLVAELTIHNGLHCQHKKTCPWPQCTNFARSDHFFGHLDVELNSCEGDTRALPSFPPAWKSEIRWSSGLEQAALPLDIMAAVLEEGTSATDALGAAHAKTQTWIAEAVAWIPTVLAGIVRDVWVHPSAAREPVRSARTEVSRATQLDRQDVLASDITREAKNGGAPASLLKRCLKWLKPEQPQPTKRRRINGAIASPEATHETWKGQLLSQQCADRPPLDIQRSVEQRAEQLVAKARSRIGTGSFDGHVTEHEVREIVHSWDDS